MASDKLAHDLETKPRTSDIQIEENHSFTSFLLSEATLQGLQEAGFYRPSPVQLKAIPLGKIGLDLIVQAKSGTGKTAVFAIVALEMVDVKKAAVQALILAPTREIAVQSEQVITTLGRHFQGLQVGSFIGGMPVQDDIKRIKQCHIVVGAPGRLKHLIEKDHIKTNSIRLFVLDEADKLLEKSFQSDINYIYQQLPERKQMLTLSATYSDELQEFLRNYMQTPTFVTPEVENAVLLGIRQFVALVKSYINVTRQLNVKTELLVNLLSKIQFTQCLIFFNSQSRAEGISDVLNKQGWKNEYISAAQSQTKRLKVLNSLKKFECRILLSTDLTARGIDAANVDLVINYEVPEEAATYLHRMGRAGRYGSYGLCITIAADGEESRLLQKILGEIGGSTFSIAKLPELTETPDKDIWKSDFGTFEKFGAVLNNADRNNSELLKDSIFNLKKTSSFINDDINDVKEMLDRKLALKKQVGDKYAEADAETLLKHMAGDKSVSKTEIINEKEDSAGFENVKDVLEKKQEFKKRAREKYAEVDAEALLKSLAGDETMDKNEVTAGVQNIKQMIENKQQSKKQTQDKYAELDAKTLLKTLAGNGSIKEIKIEDKEPEQPTTEESEEQNIINPASLYPWVPVDQPVLDKNKYGENLLQYSDCEAEKPDNSKMESIKNAAFDTISNLVVNNSSDVLNCEENRDQLFGAVGNMLQCMKQQRQQVTKKAIRFFENISCRELLEDTTLHSEEWQAALEQEHMDPLEDIFKTGYLYMVKNGKHWVDVLGDRYEPVVEKQEEVEEEEHYEDEEMEECEEEEYEEEREETVVDSHWSSRRARSDAWNYDVEHNTHVRDAQNVPDNMNIDYEYNPVYASYFDYYEREFKKAMPYLKDDATFNSYFAQWKVQMRSVRDFVQQNIYLEEMKQFQYHYYNNNYPQHN